MWSGMKAYYPLGDLGDKSALQSRIESADSEAMSAPNQTRHGHYNSSYQQAINQKCNRLGVKSPSGYGAIG